MSVRTKSLIALVTAMVLLAAPAAGARAATRTVVEPATTSSEFYARAGNHYLVEMTAERTARQKAATVAVSALTENPKVWSVETRYSTHGLFAEDDGFAAKLPGLGRIDVHFKATKENTVPLSEAGCKGREPVVRKGFFRGTITIRGERGFPSVHRYSAPGFVHETFRQVCHEVVRGNTPEPVGIPTAHIPPSQRIASVDARRTSGGAIVSFSGTGPRLPEQPGAFQSGIPTVEFAARYSGRSRGMQVLALASLDTGSNTFSVPTPIGTLTEATVAPTAPFAGTAAFHLESPKTASWTGDLSVVLPGLGNVPLAGPGFSANLCEESTCTETLPPVR